MTGHGRRRMAPRMMAILMLLGIATDVTGRLASVSSAAEPLRGVLHLRVGDPTDPHRRNLRLDQSGVLPLKAGERFRIEARLSRPAYLYLFWLGSDAKVAPIYPWKSGHWDARPEREERIDRLDLPAEADKAWEIPAGSPGIETLLLLVCEESPLPPRTKRISPGCCPSPCFQLGPDQRGRLAGERSREHSGPARPRLAQHQDPQERRPRPANPPALER